MSDKAILIGGELIRLKDNGDQTYSVAMVGGIDQTTPGSTNGVQINSVSAAKLTKAGTVAEEVTLTNANQDYAATTAMAAGVKYLCVYCASAVIVAMGAATSATNGVGVGAGQPTVFPVTRTGTAADDKPHAQSASAGAVVRFTWLAD